MQELDKSPNQSPWCNPWHRYESPAVIRKHGPEFLERLWFNSQGSHKQRSINQRRRLLEHQ